MVPVNMWAVLVSAVVFMIVGFLWYGPVFGNKWMKEMGITEADKQAAQKKGSMGKNYLMLFISSLVMSYIFAIHGTFAAQYFHMSGAWLGVQGGFFTWLGFIAPVTLGGVLWEKKSWTLWVLNNGYYLVSLVIAGVIIMTWM